MKKINHNECDNLSLQNVVMVDESLIKKYISTDRLLRPWSKDGKKGFVITSKYGSDAIGHRDGKVVMLPKEFIIGHMGRDGMAVIQQSTEGELFGYADCETGNIIEPCYNYTYPFNEGLGNVRLTEEQLLKRRLSTK